MKEVQWSRVSSSVVLLCAFVGLYGLNVPHAHAIPVSTSIYISICGDGVVQPDEVCDDGTANNVGGYGSTTAQRHCNAGCQSFGPYCGDGVLQVRFGEQCDDGNAVSGDLCSATCQTETPVNQTTTGAPPVGSIPQVPGATQGTLSADTPTKVVLRGKAYPNALVNILLDGKVLGSVRSDSNADFFYTTTDITPGTATFSFSAQDAHGTNSLMSTVVFDVIESAVTTVANIFLPPTIELSSDHVIPGDLLTISGQSVPLSNVYTQVIPDATTSIISTVDGAGNWALQLDTSSFANGKHTAKGFFVLSDTVKSGFGQSVGFTVGPGSTIGGVSPDLNGDGKVNLVDFSIFLISWNTTNPRTDFNQDGITSLADFSIMLFNWTG